MRESQGIFPKPTPSKSLLPRLELAAYLLLPITLLLLPADFFDHGPTLCVSKLIFQKDCLGCGLTRATMHLIHLEFSKAMAFNPLCLVALPLLVFLVFRRVKKLLPAAGLRRRD